ncbi:MAG: Bug family tripartite tricarboxylate transporter substrate binding protein [Cupriavidus necator]
MNFLRRAALLRTAVLAVTGCSLLVGAAPAFAQAKPAFPDRPLRIVVPGAPGGATDMLARSLGAGLSKALGQAVVVDNKPGASGIIAAQSVLAAPHDGYTMYLGITSMIQLPALMPSMPVNFSKDFAPVSLLATGSDLLAVSSKLPASSVSDFIKLAKASPGKLTIGSYGNGTSAHLHAELLKKRAGIDLIHVPYTGAAPLLSDLLAGQIDAAFIDQSTANAQLASPKLRFLALTGTQRFKGLPKLPTFGELGYAGFEPNGFMAVFVPANTPAPVVQRLSRELAAQVRGADISKRLADTGMVPVGSTSAELAAMMSRDAPLWAQVVKECNVKLE